MRTRVGRLAGWMLAVSVLTGVPAAQGQSSSGRGQPAATDRDSARAAAPAVAAGQPIALNFKDADIDSVVGAFGLLLNRTFIIDPRVRGKITLETPRPVPPREAYELLQSTLRLQGFSIVETGTVSRVVPEADARLQAGPVGVGRAAPGGDQVVTQIFRLNYESASNLVPVLRPLISPNNTIVAYPSNNSLVITDYAGNLQRVARIISTLDSPASGDVEVVRVQHALASDIALQLNRLLDEQARAGGGGAPGAVLDPGQRVMVLADGRINSIMIRTASGARMNLAKSLIARLDQPSSEPGNIRVVYLRNAEAVRLVQVLRSVLVSETGQPGGSIGQNFGAGGQAGYFAGQQQGAFAQQQGMQGGLQGGLGQGAGLGNSPATSALSQAGASAGVVTIAAGGAVIAADPATNSLIITAPEPVYRNLRAVIDKLDARRVQVYIESLIVEVSAERAMELGVQWQFLGAPTAGKAAVIGGTNLPARNGGGNIIDAATNILGLGRGLNLGVVSGKPLIGGTSADGSVSVGPINLAFLARALETEVGANILATPNLVTLDNEEARIIIGQNVPFVTGSYSNTGSAGGAVNPFQTIERKDVGTTLRVRPQVAEGGTVRLQIFQEVSSVLDSSLSMSSGLITNKRAIESNVLVDDGQLVVLGGLIEEKLEGNVAMVPGLGRLPIIGNLFRYDNRKRVKTNLMVFLRPVVLRNAEASYNLTADRYDYIRLMQGDSRVTPSELVPESQMRPSVLTPMPPRPGTAGMAPPSASPALNESMPERWRTVVPPVAPSGVPAAAPGTPPAGGGPGAASIPSRGQVIQTAPNEVVIPLNLSAPAGAAAN